MVSNIRKYNKIIIKIFTLILILVFAVYPLSVEQKSLCTLKFWSEPVVCCCNNNKKCSCSENNEISCPCKINEEEPVEEQKDPLNLNLNFQKLITFYKSYLLIHTTIFENSNEVNFFSVKQDYPPEKSDIYLEISNLRI
ncbi:MAG: hypothetical protein JW917_08545 [Ignavibacteria bacterium]|nr:hypothetical protein [Ignavibacteria bacterium]